MNKNVPQTQKELEEKTIDDIARFCMLAAREIRRVEQGSGKRLISTLPVTGMAAQEKIICSKPCQQRDI